MREPDPPDPEVPEKKPRRRFTAKYKLRILEEAANCNQPGQIGALLRRTWRRQRDEGQLQGLRPKKRGRKVKAVNPLARRVAELERETQQLREKLRKAEIIIEVQKKVSEILGIPQDHNEENNS
jgi:transposase-like protein